MRPMGATQEAYYHGVRMGPYDLVRELVLAMAGVGIVALLFAAFLSSPDVAPVTLATGSQSDPVDFVTPATGERAGSTTSAGYGQPYNSTADVAQNWGPISPQAWFGVRIPVDSANVFVMEPLQRASFSNTDLGTAGPLPVMMSNLLSVAQSGGLDGLLVINGRFYQTDYTQPLLFMGDGGYLAGLANQAHLTGSLWGMMNETGQYPGQTWLWLYTMWYQVFPF